MVKKINIDGLLVLGDSLTDRGTMYDSLIPTALSGLSKSPLGRFTNGRVWLDREAAVRISDDIISDMKANKRMSSEDIADAVISEDKRYKEKTIAHDYTLKNHRGVGYKGSDFIRSYAEGGATSQKRRFSFGKDMKGKLARLAVSNLGAKRKQLLNDDKKLQFSNEEKAKKLIVEWTGANDLVTTTTIPSKQNALTAVQARIENIKELKKNGYKNFVLFNLPDLGRTPRFSRLGGDAQENASEVSEYFNELLQQEMDKLKQDPEFADCNLEIFDANSQFKAVMDDPEAFGFDSESLSTPFQESKLFELESKLLDARKSNNKSLVKKYEMELLDYRIEQSQQKNDNFNELWDRKRKQLNPQTDSEIEKFEQRRDEAHVKAAREYIDLNNLRLDILSPDGSRSSQDLENQKKRLGISADSLRGGNHAFFDDVHPTSKMHAMISDAFNDFVNAKFKMDMSLESKSAKELYHQLRGKHLENLSSWQLNRSTFHNKMSAYERDIKSRSDLNEDQMYQKLLNYAVHQALSNKSSNSYKAYKNLGWDKNNSSKALKDAKTFTKRDPEVLLKHITKNLEKAKTDLKAFEKELHKKQAKNGSIDEINVLKDKIKKTESRVSYLTKSQGYIKSRVQVRNKKESYIESASKYYKAAINPKDTGTVNKKIEKLHSKMENKRQAFLEAKEKQKAIKFECENKFLTKESKQSDKDVRNEGNDTEKSYLNNLAKFKKRCNELKSSGSRNLDGLDLATSSSPTLNND